MDNHTLFFIALLLGGLTFFACTAWVIYDLDFREAKKQKLRKTKKA